VSGECRRHAQVALLVLVRGQVENVWCWMIGTKDVQLGETCRPRSGVAIASRHHSDFSLFVRIPCPTSSATSDASPNQ
jgi:hypothetical protein